MLNKLITIKHIDNYIKNNTTKRQEF